MTSLVTSPVAGSGVLAVRVHDDLVGHVLVERDLGVDDDNRAARADLVVQATTQQDALLGVVVVAVDVHLLADDLARDDVDRAAPVVRGDGGRDRGVDEHDAGDAHVRRAEVRGQALSVEEFRSSRNIIFTYMVPCQNRSPGADPVANPCTYPWILVHVPGTFPYQRYR